jgi:DNA-binding PadR family transcriptional regulator
MKGIITSDLIRGHIDTIILYLLDKKDMYGYLIIKEIGIQSNSLFELKEATLYSSLKRLEKDSMISSYWGEHDLGARRKYYRISEDGQALLKQNIENWVTTQEIINKILEVK